MEFIQVYREGKETIKLKPTRDISFQHGLMAEHAISVNNYRVPKPINIQIGDYIEYKGIRYTVNTVPDYSKVEHTIQHQYNIVFEAPIFRLYDKFFRHLGNSEFAFFGTAEDHVSLLIGSINEIDDGWTMGDVSPTGEQHTYFDGVSCKVALTQIAETFGLEWSVNGKEITMIKQIGVDRNITLQYGRGNGLYNISREYVQEKNVITRVYGVGGSRNLPQAYPFSRLQLPNALEANIDLYGIKEGEYRNDDLFPTRTGMVTNVETFDPQSKFHSLQDIDLDFNINDYLAPGLTAKIGFQSGELAGYEFEITKYDHTTKTISYLSNTDTSTGLTLPNENFKAAVGDKYKLLDIYLPQSYVDFALTRLEDETRLFLDENKAPQVRYGLSIDVLHFKRNGYDLNPGDRIRIIDPDIKIDTTVRVTSVSYPLSLYITDSLWNGIQYSAELANFVPYTVQERILKDTAKNKREIRQVSRASEQAKRASDEISRAAAINQFLRTYVGELAVLSGAFVAGNPDLGAVAGISGLEDTLDAIRIWSGSDFDSRDSAPYRVNQAGQFWATDAFIKGVIEALSGKIGNWNITDGGIINEDGSAYIIARENLGVDQEATAMIGANVLSAVTGLRAVGLFRNTENAPLFTNYGLILEVNGGGDNIALDILSGQLASLNLRSRQINSTSTLMRTDVWISSYNTDPITISLPSSPNNGKIVYVRQMNSSSITFNGNGINIHVAGNVGTIYTNMNANIGDCHQFVYDGQFWCYNQLYREVPA
ncbi:MULTISPECIES: phage tail protein [Olivibacter]|uniref:Phage tail protein n=1 Tax=Olivibacter jilunii TaxID=985016 RepID=A0ABW6AZ13_9SPHI